MYTPFTQAMNRRRSMNAYSSSFKMPLRLALARFSLQPYNGNRAAVDFTQFQPAALISFHNNY